MALTGKLGTSDSILGISLVLGVEPEVGGDPLSPTAESTLALTQETIGAGPKEASASSTIVVSQDADFTQGVFGLIAQSTIVLSDSVEQNIFNLEAVTPDSGGITDSWVQEAYLAETYDLSASSTIVATQDLPQPSGKRSVSAESVLELLDFADNNVKVRSVVSTIALTQTADVEFIYRASSVITITQQSDEGFVSLSAENTLFLDDTARSNPYERAGESSISLTQEAMSSIKNLSAESTIDIEQDIGVQRPYQLSATTSIIEINQEFDPDSGTVVDVVVSNLTQEATVTIDAVRSVEHIISFAQVASVVLVKVGATDLSAESTLTITDEAISNQQGDATSTISLTSVADYIQSEDGLNTIDMSQEAIVKVVQTLSAVNALVMKQAVGYTLERDTTKCDYSPFVGDSEDSDVPSPPSPTLPEEYTSLPASVRFRLAAVPFEDGSTTDVVDLRAPEFGNTERIETTRINRESAGGTLQVYADPVWPRVHQLVLQFSALKTDQARELLRFIERTLGGEIGVLDHERRIWRAVITNPQEAVIQDGRENHSVTLEMEAERVSV